MSLIIHPLTHEVYKLPEGAVKESVAFPAWLFHAASFELVVRAGRFRPELFAPRPTAAQIVLVNLGPEGPFTWGCRFQVQIDGDGLRDKLERRTGERFLFLWPLECAVEVARHHHNEQFADALDTILRSHAQRGAAPPGPDDIEGCTRVDPLVDLSATERVFVAMLTPLWGGCPCPRPRAPPDARRALLLRTRERRDRWLLRGRRVDRDMPPAWGDLPTDLVVRVFAFAMAASIVVDAPKVLYLVWCDMRGVCRGARALCDGVLFLQLARLHDEARMLACSNRRWEPWIPGHKCLRRDAVPPAACAPSLTSARSAALGIGCVEVLRLPLQRVPRLGTLDHGDWPLPERRFVACPKVGAYLAVRKKADAAVEAAFAVIGSRELVEERRAFLRAHAPRAPGDAAYEMRTDPEAAIVKDMLGQ